MTSYDRTNLERYRRRIDPSSELFEEELNPADIDLLQEFDQALEDDPDKGVVTQGMRLEAAIVFSKHHDEHGAPLTAIRDGDEDAIEAFMDWVTDRRIPDPEGGTKPLSKKSRDRYASSIRAIGRLLTPGPDLPEYLEDVSFGKKEQSDPAPHPSTILWWDDHVVRMCDHREVPWRDRALVAVAWDSGARHSELHRLTLGDIEVHNNHIGLTVWYGKTGSRVRRLIPSMPYLLKWIEEHPVNDELPPGADPVEDAPQDTPLWTRLDENVKHESKLTKRTKRAGRKAGVSRPTNLKQFRKSRASILAMDPLVSEDSLRTAFGWKSTSHSPQHYKAQFGLESDAQIAAADGADVDLTPDHEDPAPVECPRCERWTPRHRDCLWCSARFDPDAATENQAAKLRTDQRVAEFELLAQVAQGEISLETLRQSVEFAGVMEENPDILDEAEAFLEAREDEDLGTAAG